MSLNGQKQLIQRHIPELLRLPRPIYGRFESLPQRTQTHRHSHPWIQLSYAIEGVLEIQTDEGLFIAPPQRAVWIPAGVVHKVISSAKTEMRSLYIECSAVQRHSDSCQVLRVSSLLRELISTFSLFPIEYEMEGAEGRLAQVLLDQLNMASEVDLVLPWPKDQRLTPLCQTLANQLDDSATLADWSGRLGVSEKTLSRLFLKETGLSFRAWRQRLRLFGSLSALGRGERVTDVALSVGYDSTSAFIAAFGRQFGASPSAFFQSI